MSGYQKSIEMKSVHDRVKYRTLFTVLFVTFFTHSISCMILLTYIQLLSASCLYSQFRH